MRQSGYRQVVIVGLVFFMIGLAARLVWARQEVARAQADLKAAGRWLDGVVVVVDPGHGGQDPGGVVDGTQEKQVVLEIALQLKRLLETQGAKVVLTRDRDMDHGGTIRAELSKRVALIAKHKGQLFISIHANKDRCRCWGAQTFFQRHGMPAGKQLAESIQNQLRLLTPTTRSALSADYFVLRTSPVPAAMVEVGFLTNAGEHERLKQPAYQQRLASAILLGLSDFVRSQVPPAKADGEIGK
jgi:N-acetylmuramoyl-L-alanine amidase